MTGTGDMASEFRHSLTGILVMCLHCLKYGWGWLGDHINLIKKKFKDDDETNTMLDILL